MTSAKDRWIAWRRDIHRHPELGFREERTAAMIAELLENIVLVKVVGAQWKSLNPRPEGSW